MIDVYSASVEGMPGSSASSLTMVARRKKKANQCQDEKKNPAFPTTSIFLRLWCLSYISTALALDIPQGVM